MLKVPSDIQERLVLQSRQSKHRGVMTELQRCRVQAGQLTPEELHDERIRATACLTIALEKLQLAIRDMRIADAEDEMQKAFRFAAWKQACEEATVRLAA